MCELCDTITNEKLLYGVSIVKTDNNTYELTKWKSKDSNFLDDEYVPDISIPVKCCPECGDRLGYDMTLEEADFTVRTYHSLKRNGINFINELRKLSYDDLIQIRNIGDSNIREINNKLKLLR